jgi:hypothetical protein
MTDLNFTGRISRIQLSFVLLHHQKEEERYYQEDSQDISI